MPYTFTTDDKNQISDKGIPVYQVKDRLNAFQTGFPYANISGPALVGDGIMRLNDEKLSDYIEGYEQALKTERVLKFVPASGAASRMFKVLSAFMNSSDKASDLIKTEEYKPVKEFFDRIEDFAFYPKLRKIAENEDLDLSKDYKEVLRFFLTDKGMNYANLPKALLLFHSYASGNRTALEEHFTEGINYASRQNEIPLHFTVSEEHKELFEEELQKLISSYSSSRNLKFEIEISTQKSYTDTIAVDMNNEPFRLADGSILFRPGGHGALIENLNDLNAEIIFVKNIDNIVPDHYKKETYTYKKALGGVLVDVRNKSFYFLEKLNHSKDEDLLKEAASFARKTFNYTLPENFSEYSKKKQRNYLFDLLDRPIRVCGMVKNGGEPGGGPFYVKNEDGEESLQIVEGSQIDPDSKEKQDIVGAATHFNPVDLVLSTRDFEGIGFDLHEFVDPQTAFISEKSVNGKSLKAMELPGLWNGAMAKWNTVFVEVPVVTFNPVKTINDLLRDMHQPG
ncbi:MAG: DUF4301 family protein [Bacteroidota bacterium]|nr:DUF4301 family protein [Bacteroidota bacterium]